MTIHLAQMLPSGSSDLPGNSDGPSSSVPLFGLAPSGVYLAPAVTDGTGELLPHLFTLTLSDIKNICQGGILSVALCLPVAGTGHYPASCPMEPGLSSPLPKRRAAAIRSTPTYPIKKVYGTRCKAYGS